MLAAINGHEEVARRLVEVGADIHIRGTGAPGFSDKTALELATDLGRQAIVELLRDREA
jgi:ankyrin repeat protein